MPIKIKIAVTGGPSGGKTTLIEALQKDLANKISVVPEAASILYRGGFPRRPTLLARTHAQRAICYIQRELEDLNSAESKNSVLVCDRGSLDSIAYWPGPAEDFFHSMATTKDQELLRYQWVVHLDTASADHFDSSNPIRTESHLEAEELNTRIKEAWQGHPQRIIIGHQDEFLAKILTAKRVVEWIMEGYSYADIQKSLMRISE